MAETTTAAAASAEAHVVEIPMDSGTDTDTTASQAQQQRLLAHPLSEISASPGHLLLLKLYQREEDQLAHRTGLREARLDAIKRDAFRLSSLFLSFHALFLTLLFAASVGGPSDAGRACRNWWVPSCLSLLTSAVLVLSVQLRVREYWRVLGGLQGDRDEARALARRVQELRMKGASFDLSRGEPSQGAGAAKRMKSSSVEARWRPARWLSQNLVTVCLFFLAGLLVPACKFVLCT